jgi:XTP/dITP diphosphohydrolase/ATP diphosphatase
MNSDLSGEAAGSAFAEAVSIMSRLRGPDGCPWDREQTFDSIRKYTLEETYEVLDAIERRDWSHLKEELGDLLLQVLFYSQMAAEASYFTLAEVIDGLNRKLVRRHPHVFGDAASAAAGNAAPAGMETSGIDANQVLRNWEQIKRAEKAASASQETPSLLDSIPRSFPALMEAAKLGSKAAKVGFDWPEVGPVFAKLDEEILELKEALNPRKGEHFASKSAKISEKSNAEVVDEAGGEVGDLLFTTVNLARHLGVDPELALRGTNEKFRRRFAAMEKYARLPLEKYSPEQLEGLWNSAKDGEKALLQDGIK